MAAPETMNIPTLPDHLAERYEFHGRGEVNPGGEFVLYWAHHALRSEQNPALQVAARLALELDLPLLVYQGLGGRHRYNADRHHRFILEAARDLSASLAKRGQRLVFNLPSDPLKRGPIRDLMARSALTVSELYPVPPFTVWYRQHLASNPDLTLVLVDASCILPMPASGKKQTRAFVFRRKHGDELDARVLQGWQDSDQWPQAFAGDVGFEPFDLSRPLDDAIAACDIDHAIPPQAGTVGGSTAALERWNRFLESGLSNYHRLRNDAALPDAVSRMSAYLHYGCIPVFRVAQDARHNGGEGAQKFLDELLVWRELSHHFCYHTSELESLAALPQWASESLTAHEADPRQEMFDWETLARAQTGNPLWDLAQRSLLRHGELHNNLRMTWGKALLRWTPRANRALKLMIDLNHRYALDGNDPNSYGGLLWCMGQFDRAFPPGPVFGKVRQRSLARHAKRLDCDRYARTVSAPAGGRKLRVGVVGAGLSGLTAARILTDQGHDVVVVDKGRGAGGRMSARRDGELSFDHGAQYFTARDPRFLRHVVAWQERGLVEPWNARIATMGDRRSTGRSKASQRFVAVPGMNAICHELAAGLPDCRFDWQLETVQREGSGWIMYSTDGKQLECDVLLMTTPPEQARTLLNDAEVDSLTGKVRMLPCWALMLTADTALFADHDAAFVNQGPLSWVAAQHSRPGRPAANAWVLHASSEWSEKHLESSPETVQDMLLDAVRELPLTRPFEVTSAVTHRWRYALADQALNCGALWLGSKQLALAGDWCNGSRVEGAFLSGVAAAGRIMAAHYQNPLFK
jgi:photolyase PhrII